MKYYHIMRMYKAHSEFHKRLTIFAQDNEEMEEKRLSGRRISFELKASIVVRIIT